MSLTFRRGRLSYRRQGTGEERGREDFWLTRNRDGTRTLRCLAITDDSEFVRDASYTVGIDGRPVDVWIRLQVGSSWVGSGYFRIQGSRLHVVVDGVESGHVEQALEVPDRVHVMTHAVMLDGWTFWGYDAEAGGKQDLTVYNTSTRWNGTDGPLGRLEAVQVTALGDEELEVPAGRFPCRKYLVSSEVIPDSPPSELWVTGEDSLLVRYGWDGLGLEYVLSELE